MKCKVENEEVACHLIGPPVMNFGQKWRYKEYDELIYEFVFSISEFTKIINTWFEVFRSEAIEDDVHSVKGEFPVYDHFAEKEFPVLKDLMLNHHELLTEIIMDNDLDVLNAIDSVSTTDEKKNFLINSLDWVKVGDKVSLGGKAHKLT